jgi:protein-S-isoprenylcysteine O-methyltransferase Ste14
VRHPFYLGFAALIVFLFCVSANLLIGSVALGAFAMILLRTPIEERKLVEHFGSSYQRYMELTGRFLPRFR